MMLPRLGALLGIVLLVGQAVPGEPPEAAPLPRGLDQHLDPMPSGVSARMGTVRWRLEARTFGFAVFSADSQQLTGISGTGVAQVWDVASGREVRRLSMVRPGTPAITSALASPDGRLLVMYGQDKTFRGWDAATGQELWQVPGVRVNRGGGLIGGIVFSPDARLLVTEAGGGIWSVRQAATGEELCRLPFTGTGLNPVFAPDGLNIAMASQDSVVRIWESQTGKKLHELGKPVDAKTGFSYSPPPGFSPDGQRLAVVTYTFQRPNNVIRDKTVTVWDILTGQQVSQTKLADNTNNQNISAFSGDLRYLAHVGPDLSMRLHDLATGKELHQLGGPQPNGFARQPIFAPDGKTLVIPGNRNERGVLEIHAFDTASGKELWRREASSTTLTFSPNSALVATAMPVGLVQMMQVWDARTGKDLTDAFGHRGPIQVLALSRDQKTLTSQASDGVRQWEMATGKELRHHEQPEGSRRYLRTVSPDGQTAAYMTEANGKMAIQLWDLAGDKALRQIDFPQPGLQGLSFSPDSQTLAVRGAGVDRVARLFEVSSGKERSVLSEQLQAPGMMVGNAFPKTGFAFAPDGGTLATTWSVTIQTNPNMVDRRDVIYLTRTSNGRPLGRIEPGRGASILATAFSPDGRNVAGVVTQPGVAPNPAPATSLVLWERITGKERHRFSTEPADGLAIAPDGRSVAVGHRDGAIHFYELGTGRVIAKLTGHLSGVNHLLFSPDGRQLISGSNDTTALVWDLTSIRFPTLPPAIPPTAQQVQAAWTELAGADAGKAFQAIQRLGAAPGNALPMLQAELKPVAPLDRQQLDKLVADLESNDFQVREQAVEELEKIGELALPVLEKALAGDPTLEARQRLEKIRDRATGTTLSSEEIRILRALEALERMDSPAAKQVLEKLAQGAGGARQTREAQATLDWLGRRAR